MTAVAGTVAGLCGDEGGEGEEEEGEDVAEHFGWRSDRSVGFGYSRLSEKSMSRDERWWLIVAACCMGFIRGAKARCVVSIVTTVEWTSVHTRGRNVSESEHEHILAS